MKKRKDKRIMLTKQEFFLLKLFGPYWHHSRKTDKLIFYLKFLIEGIDKNKFNLGTEETEHK